MSRGIGKAELVSALASNPRMVGPLRGLNMRGFLSKTELEALVTGSVETADLAADAVTSPKIAPNAVASGDLAVSTVQYAEVEISSAELLALVATPKTLVAAPGAGKVLEFISCELAYDKGAVTYTIGNATNLQVKLGAVAVSCTRAVTGFLDQAGDKVFLLTPVGVTAIDISAVVNTAMTLTLASSDGEMTNGNGTVHAKVAYRVHATGL